MCFWVRQLQTQPEKWKRAHRKRASKGRWSGWVVRLANGKWVTTDKRTGQVNPSKRPGEQQFMVAKWRRRNTIKCNYKGHKHPDPSPSLLPPLPPSILNRPPTSLVYPPPTGRVIKWKWKILPAVPLATQHSYLLRHLKPCQAACIWFHLCYIAYPCPEGFLYIVLHSEGIKQSGPTVSILEETSWNISQLQSLGPDTYIEHGMEMGKVHFCITGEFQINLKEIENTY